MSTISATKELNLRKPILAWPLAELAFKLAAIATVGIALAVLLVLLMQIMIVGVPRISFEFLTSFPSRRAGDAGIYSALIGSIALMIVVALSAVPIGVGAALYLEEYAPKNWLTRVIELNIANLAGVPSVIYGLLGLQLFVRWAGLGRSILAGGFTLSLLILPIIVIATRESLRAVPRSLREASLALGATKWQTLLYQVVPVALPGILTGCILAFSRAIGEAAPLITIGALAYIAFLPTSVFDEFTALPIQAFNWLSRPQEAFHVNSAATIVVLLAILLILNTGAIWLRNSFEKRLAK